MATHSFAKSVDDLSPGRIVTITDIGNSLRWDYDSFKKSIQLSVYIFCKWFYEIIFWPLWWISIFMIKFDCWIRFFLRLTPLLVLPRQLNCLQSFAFAKIKTFLPWPVESRVGQQMTITKRSGKRRHPPDPEYWNTPSVYTHINGSLTLASTMSLFNCTVLCYRYEPTFLWLTKY